MPNIEVSASEAVSLLRRFVEGTVAAFQRGVLNVGDLAAAHHLQVAALQRQAVAMELQAAAQERQAAAQERQAAAQERHANATEFLRATMIPLDSTDGAE